MNILVVEDEKAIANLIRLSLKTAGYTCSCAADGEEAADRLTEETFDLVLLDVMLPKIDGFSLMDFIRPLGVPVIFLTARSDLADRVKGLRLGGEDYIVKPFEVEELLARVEAVLRRCGKGSQLLTLGDLSADPRARRVWSGGKEISLTPKEFDLLLFFLRNPNTALYRDVIYAQVWGGELAYGSRTVDLHVQRLRKKVGWEDRLRAVAKIGYRLEGTP
jgi:DNA-binding response OmpR family regulator